ncbi:MAG: OmpA family protein [Pseudomonadota bacterium]
MIINFHKVLALTALGATISAYSGVSAAAEFDPGWYIGIEGFSAQPKEASGSRSVGAAGGGTAVAPTSTGACPTGSTAVGLLDPLNALVPSGVVTPPIAVLPSLCVIAPAGGGSSTPGVPAIPGAPGSSASSSSTIAFKRGFGGGVNLGYLFSNGFRPELALDYVKNDIKTYTVGGNPIAGADEYSLNAYRAMANVWYDFDFGSALTPYIGAGVGMQRSEFDAASAKANASTFTYQAGAGLDYWMTRRLALSLDYRYVVAGEPEFEFASSASTKTTQTINYKAQQIGLGLKYVFGATDAAPPAAPVEPAEVVAAVVAEGDSDGDGVVDSKDKCPDTPAGAQVNEDGCSLDSDGDGVPNSVDECPNSPAGAKVLANGCALAGDCRTPKEGEAVDEKGCAVNKAFILKGVNFEFDSERLTAEAKEILNSVGETLQSYADLKIEVGGHTDDVGTEAYNLGLSERRANVVKTYLAGRGVDVSRLSAVGYGKTKPLSEGMSEEDRAKNRRVELNVRD